VSLFSIKYSEHTGRYIRIIFSAPRQNFCIRKALLMHANEGRTIGFGMGRVFGPLPV